MNYWVYIISNEEIFLQDFSSNSEAFASELLEIFEKMFTRLKSST